MAAPPWLEPLLSTEFFSGCHVHGDAPRSECNMYCLNCNVGAFCFYCRSARHKDHHVVQIRRSSYHNVVRVAEIQKAVDIGGVQTYVINSARVIFLNERPQPKAAASSGAAGGGASAHHHHHSHACEICGRSLLEPLRFCSLGCKGLRETRTQALTWELGMMRCPARGKESHHRGRNKRLNPRGKPHRTTRRLYRPPAAGGKASLNVHPSGPSRLRRAVEVVSMSFYGMVIGGSRYKMTM